MKTLNYQETSSLLAGLRVLQDMVEDGTLDEYPRKLPHFDDVDPLTSEQIDELCKQLNTSEITVNGE